MYKHFTLEYQINIISHTKARKITHKNQPSSLLDFKKVAHLIELSL